MNVRKIIVGFSTGLPKNFFQSSTFSCPGSERKDKNENYLEETIAKTFFPGLVKISFDIPADFFFQKSENFCSPIEKNASMKNNFDAKKFLGKLLRPRKVQVWKQFKKNSLDVIAQTQKTKTSLLHFQKQVLQMNRWTCRMQIGDPAEVFLWEIQRRFS